MVIKLAEVLRVGNDVAIRCSVLLSEVVNPKSDMVAKIGVTM